MGGVRLHHLSVVLFTAAGLLLASMGGAVFAAPLTLPLMYLAVRRHPTPLFRWIGGVIAGLTTLELVWAIVYVLGGEAKPTIWLVPVVAGLSMLALVATTRGADRQGMVRPVSGTRPRPR